MKITQITEYKRPRVRGNVSGPIQTTVNNILQLHGPTDKDEIAEQLEKKLKKLGWEEIGMGCFSSVFRHPHKSYVLKVNQYPDKAFQKFAEISKKFPNRHFLKVGDTKVIEFNGRPYYIYTLEKLYPVTSLPAGLEVFSAARFLEWVADHPWASIAEFLLGRFNPSNTLIQWVQNHPSLIKACQILGKNKLRVTIDIHEDNIMQRNDGTIVIVDPFSYYRT